MSNSGINFAEELTSMQSSQNKRSSSGLDFQEMSSEIIADDRKEYSQLKRARQYVIKSDVKCAIDKLFRQFKVYDTSDCVDCLRYAEKTLLDSQPDAPPPAADDFIQDHLTTLTLPQRNTLIRLLTHSADGQQVDNALRLFPSIRERSTQLAQTIGRKTRSDKTDLQFISDFMHDICR